MTIPGTNHCCEVGILGTISVRGLYLDSLALFITLRGFPSIDHHSKGDHLDTDLHCKEGFFGSDCQCKGGILGASKHCKVWAFSTMTTSLGEH